MFSYLDHNATTPLDQRVVEAMLPYLGELFGNPSSRHRFGRLARVGLDQAREQVAALVGVSPAQVLFTSGGTESNLLALQGCLEALPKRARVSGRLLCSAVEHPSVLAAAERLQGRGWRFERLPVDSQGRVVEVEEKVGDETRLVSVMLANNETGVLQDLEPVAAASRRVGAVLHTDAVQAAGKLPLDFAATGAQLMSLSAHKLYGPKGAGALIRDLSVDLLPVQQGGGQEAGLRGGTENVAAMVGFGRAAELAKSEMDRWMTHTRILRDQLEAGLSGFPEVTLFGAAAARLPNTVMFAVAGIEGETLLMELDRRGLAVSSGSACSSGSTEPSHVLLAMGVPAVSARNSVRVSLGRDNSAADVNRLLNALGQMISMLRKMARAR